MSRGASLLKQVTSVHSGGLCEGDIFSILGHSRFVVRSVEAALADGAVDCTRSFLPDSSFAERFWESQSREPLEWGELLLFDVKGTTAGEAGLQIFMQSSRQRRHVAFYICMCATSPAFVELIPNYAQDRTPVDWNDESQGDHQRADAAINTTRVSRFPPHTYDTLDPCGTPNRMPISLLAHAIEGVRRHARREGVYVNPWTQVAHPDWKPVTTRDLRCLVPQEGTANFTAYERLLEIQQVTFRHGSMRFGFVGLAPLLADFAFFFRDHDDQWQQRFIQHKVDGRYRAKGSTLHKVGVQRDGQFYFRETERFDFYMAHFEFGSMPPFRICYFIPEKIIPDRFYTSQAKEESFEIPEFVPYRIIMDDQLRWIDQIQEILKHNPQPRATGPRPCRPPKEATPQTKSQSATIALSITTAPEAAADNAPVQAADPSGFKRYTAISELRQRQLFYGLMDECARRGSGLLVVHAWNHPIPDITFHQYRWTAEEQQEYEQLNRLPQFAHTLGAETPGVAICYYVHDRNCWYQGPSVTPAQYRRLNSNGAGRLILWDIGGPDITVSQPLIAVVPSDDFQPTRSQALATSAKQAKAGRAQRWDPHRPRVSAMLRTGLHLSEYVARTGPLAYSGVSWAPLWQLLNQFAGVNAFEHPPGRSIMRHPLKYQHTMQALNSRLAQEQRSDGPTWDDDEEVETQGTM